VFSASCVNKHSWPLPLTTQFHPAPPAHLVLVLKYLPLGTRISEGLNTTFPPRASCASGEPIICVLVLKFPTLKVLKHLNELTTEFHPAPALRIWGGCTMCTGTKIPTLNVLKHLNELTTEFHPAPALHIWGFGGGQIPLPQRGSRHSEVGGEGVGGWGGAYEEAGGGGGEGVSRSGRKGGGYSEAAHEFVYKKKYFASFIGRDTTWVRMFAYLRYN
jgi:hypothetical protein